MRKKTSIFLLISCLTIILLLFLNINQLRSYLKKNLNHEAKVFIKKLFFGEEYINEVFYYRTLNYKQKKLPNTLFDYVILEKHQIELHMETDLHPKICSNILSQTKHHLIRACYDIGDRASLGFEIDEEFELMSEFIGSIHIKDRPLNSTTVSLGHGNADFRKIFEFVK